MKFEHGSLDLTSNAPSEAEIEITAQYSMQIAGFARRLIGKTHRSQFVLCGTNRTTKDHQEL